MPNRVKTADAQSALRQILAEQAKGAAGSNILVSKTEAKNLNPVLQRADEAIRTEGGKGTRVRVDALVERATVDSEKTWGQFNANNQGRDGVWLSNAEVADIKQADPALGALTELALLRVRGRGTPTPTDPAAATTAVKNAAAALDFDKLRLNGLPGGTKIDARPGQAARANVPAGVLASFDHFYRAENADWATVRLFEGKLGGEDVKVLYCTTDGDDEYLEIYKTDGEPMASARLWGGADLVWDDFFGRDKLSPNMINLDRAGFEDGMSEPAERAAAGQVPSQWKGDVFIDAGKINHLNNHIVSIDVPANSTMSVAQKQVATAGFELIFARSLTHRRDSGNPPIDIARMGSMSVGEFTRPTDGQKYEVAYWKDVDDDTHAYYFQRNPAGDLALKTIQYDN